MRSLRLYGIVMVRLIFILLGLTCFLQSSPAQKTGDTGTASTVAAFKAYMLSQASKETWTDSINWDRLHKIEKFAWELDLDKIADSTIGRTIESYHEQSVSDTDTRKVLKGVIEYRDQMCPVKSEFEKAWFWLSFVGLQVGSHEDPFNNQGFSKGAVLANFRKMAVCSMVTCLCAEGMRTDSLSGAHDIAVIDAYNNKRIHSIILCFLHDHKGNVAEFYWDIDETSPHSRSGVNAGTFGDASYSLQTVGGLQEVIERMVGANYIPVRPEDWCLPNDWRPGRALGTEPYVPGTPEGMEILKSLLRAMRQQEPPANSVSVAAAQDRKYPDPLSAQVTAACGQELAYRFYAGSTEKAPAGMKFIKIGDGMIPQMRVVAIDDQGKQSAVKFLGGRSWFRNVDLGNGLWEVVARIPVPGKYILVAYCGPENDIWKLNLNKPLGKQELRVSAPAVSNTGDKHQGP